MKAIISIFVGLLLLCLSAPICDAQDKTQPPQAAPETSAPEKPDIRAASADAEPNDKERNENSDPIITTDDFSIDERMVEIADKANDLAFYQTIINGVGLFLIVAATVFACLAWLAARKGVNITDDIGKKQTRAYLHVKKPSLLGDQIHMICGTKNFLIKFTLSNSGPTPAYGVNTSIFLSLRGDGFEGGSSLHEGPLSGGVFNQVHVNADVQCECETDEIEFSEIVSDGKYIEGSGVNVKIKVSYHTIHTIGRNQNSEKFSETFLYTTDIPNVFNVLLPAPIFELNKRIT